MGYRGYSLNIEMVTEPYLYYLGVIEGEGYEVMGSTKNEAISLLKEYIDNIVGYR